MSLVNIRDRTPEAQDMGMNARKKGTIIRIGILLTGRILQYSFMIRSYANSIIRKRVLTSNPKVMIINTRVSMFSILYKYLVAEESIKRRLRGHRLFEGHRKFVDFSFVSIAM